MHAKLIRRRTLSQSALLPHFVPPSPPRPGTEARIKAMHPSLTTVKRDTVELQSELTAVMGRLEKLTAHVHTIEQKMGANRGGGGGGADDDVKHALSQLVSRVGAVENKVASLGSSASSHHTSASAAAPPRSDYASSSAPDAATYPPRQQIERIELALAQSDEALKTAEDARRRCMVLEPQCVKTVALVAALEANVHDCQLRCACARDGASVFNEIDEHWGRRKFTGRNQRPVGTEKQKTHIRSSILRYFQLFISSRQDLVKNSGFLTPPPHMHAHYT
jgi:hypothetical protein